MKNIGINIFTAVLAALTMFSCTKDNVSETNSPVNKEEISFTVCPSIGSQTTKISIEATTGNTGKELLVSKFENEDRLILAPLKYSSNNKLLKSSDMSISSDGKSASFKFNESLDGYDEVEYKYILFDMRTEHRLSTNGNYFGDIFFRFQTQEGLFSSIKKYLSYQSETTIIKNGIPDMLKPSLKAAEAVLHIKLSGINNSSTSLRNITISGEGLSNKRSRDENTYGNITINGNIPVKEGTAEIYIVVPQEMPLKSIGIVCNDGTQDIQFTKKLSSDCITKSGCEYAINLDSPNTITSFSGSGTIDDPYLIESQLDLNRLAILVNTNNSKFSKNYYKQTADITMTDSYGYTPIGNNIYNAFEGEYDGAGYAIKGKIKFCSGQEYLGLFGNVCTGTIKNVNLEAELDLSDNKEYNGKFGSIVGYLYDSNKAGCIVENCTNKNDINLPKAQVGGIVGYVYSAKEIKIEACSNHGNINGCENVGGIAGELYCTVNSSVTISGCVNKGNISASNKYAGGIVGRTYVAVNDRNNLKFLSSWTNGVVESPRYVGIFIGSGRGTQSFDNCACKEQGSQALAGYPYDGCDCSAIDKFSGTIPNKISEMNTAWNSPIYKLDETTGLPIKK